MYASFSHFIRPLIHLLNLPGLHKYSELIYDTCIASFQALPVTALIDGKFFCVHGGISPDLVYLSDLDTVSVFLGAFFLFIDRCFYS